MVLTDTTLDMPIPAWGADGVLRPLGKLAVHRQGLRHPAISVFLRDGDKVLLQQRAAGKYHTPGLWANTCCTHPHWGEPALTCATRRLRQELGITGLALRHAGQVEYRAEVATRDTPMIEHELVDVFTADADATLATAPDPTEVQALRWVSLAQLRTELRQTPQTFTPWLRIYLDQHSAMIFG